MSSDPSSTDYAEPAGATHAVINPQPEGSAAAAALTNFSQQPGGPQIMHSQPQPQQPQQQAQGKSSSPPAVPAAQPQFYQQPPQAQQVYNPNPHMMAASYAQQQSPQPYAQSPPLQQQIYAQSPPAPLQPAQYHPAQPYQPQQYQQPYPQQMQPQMQPYPGQQQMGGYPGQQPQQQPQMGSYQQQPAMGGGYQLRQAQPHPGAGFIAPPQAPGQGYAYAQGPSPAVGLPPSQQLALPTHNLTSPPYTGQRPSAYPPGFCVRVLQAQAHTNPFGRKLVNDIPLFLVCVFENEALATTPGITPELALHTRWKRMAEFEELHKLMPLGVGKLPEFPSASNRLSGWLTKKPDDPLFLTQRLQEMDKYMHAAVGFYHALMPPHLRPWFIVWLNHHIGLGPVEHLTQNALEWASDPQNQFPETDAVSSIGKGLKQSILNMVEARAPRRKLTYQEEIVRVLQKQREYDVAYLDALPLQQRPQAVRARDMMGRMQGVEAWFSLPEPDRVVAPAINAALGAAGGGVVPASAMGAAAEAASVVASSGLPHPRLPSLRDRWIFLGGMIERKLDNVGLHPGFVQARSAFYLVSEPLLYKDPRSGEEFLEVQLTHWMHQRAPNDQPGVFTVRIFPPAAGPAAAASGAAAAAAAAPRQSRIEFVGPRGAGFFCGIDLGANVVTAAEMKLIQENAGSAAFRALQQQGQILSRTFTDVRPQGF